MINWRKRNWEERGRCIKVKERKKERKKEKKLAVERRDWKEI